MEKALPVELAEMIIEASSKKTELLRRYADESPKCFRLFDGWLRGKHWLLAGLTWELMEGAHVR
jgi:hypothetical protein